MSQAARPIAPSAVDAELAPEALALVERAAALAAREGRSMVEVRHLLEGLFFRPVTASLVQHLLQAAAVAQDHDSEVIGDLHLLLAVMADANCLVNHVVSRVVDRSAVEQALRDQLRPGGTPTDLRAVPGG
jgi:hypothetical protein